jgi:hypothetical protein
MVVVLAALAALIVRVLDTTQPANSPPDWKRIDSRRAGIPARTSGGVEGAVNGRFVVVGTTGVASSTDGRSWKASTLPNQRKAVNLDGIADANRRALIWTTMTSDAGTGVPQLWSSRDGATWHQVDPTGLDQRLEQLSIVGHRDTFVATGATADGVNTLALGKVWTSHDGIHWTPGTIVNGGNQAIGNVVWFDGNFIARGPSADGRPDTPFTVWQSHDGSNWHSIGQVDVPRLYAFYAPPHSSTLYGIQFETAAGSSAQGGTFGGHLMATRDGVTWTEVGSFHRQFPVANPDHILRSHGVWILSGNTGTSDGRRRTDIWTSRDLKHWTELPRRLQGSATSGYAVPTAANNDTVIGTSLFEDHAIWLWQP